MVRRNFFRKIAGLVFIWTCAALILAAPGRSQEKAYDPLPSWNDRPAKQAIVNFVRKATDNSGPTYVAPADRIATFDQDGTTWVEQPLYAQAMFALDRVHELAPKHPEWKTEPNFWNTTGRPWPGSPMQTGAKS
jgi:hypothetical protein